MKTAAEILRTKPNQAVRTIAPNVSVFEALTVMARENIGALLVVEEERIVGILTERDYARKMILVGRTARENGRKLDHDDRGHVRAPRQHQRGMHGADDR